MTGNYSKEKRWKETVREGKPCAINFITEKAIDFDINYILSNSFGFGGTNVSLILKKFNESTLQ